MDAKAAFFLLFIAILGTALVIPFGVGQQALAQTSTNQTSTTASQGSSGPRSNNDALRGPIASVQLDENGEPSWIQSGIWVLRTLGSEQSNQTDTGNQRVQFIARFTMVMPDGTAMHTHSIYGFQASEVSQEGNSTMMNGTATVTMREGPVQDVPVTLQIFNNAVLAIFIDPEAVDAHFGDGAVYGLLSPFSRSIVEDEVAEVEEEEATDEDDETPPEEEEETPPPANQTGTIELSAEEDGEDYAWSSDDGTNPTLEMVAGEETTLEIDNPTEEEHNLVIESDGEVLEESGDIAAGEDGTLTITPEEGTLDYYCEYHPDTMVGTIEVSSSS
jgi:plastocyanin